MWKIYEKKSLAKQLKKAPTTVVKHYEIWKRIVELEGPSGLRAIKGFHDEALKGQWKGFRSSRLDRKWRVLYSTEKNELSVYIVEINPHEY